MQALTPGRVADASDVLADIFGQAIGFAGAKLWGVARANTRR
jgi:VanZ family protein